MTNNLAVADASVDLGVVGINLSTIRRDFSDEPMQDVPIGVLDGPRRYPVSLAILGTDHGGFACRASSAQVFALPADVGFIDFHRAGKRFLATVPRFAQAVRPSATRFSV